MSTQIDTNGLFSEAAYGPDGPQGLSGVTGNGVAHEAAWKQALVQAKTLLFSETELPAQAASAPPVVDAPNAALVSAPETDAKAGHPLSWDRLSMTVASMVAWNMSVEMADDVAAPPLTDDPLAMKSEALAAGVSVEPGPLVEAIDGPAPVRSTVLSSSLVGDESTAAVEPLILTSDGARAEVGAMVDTGVDPNTVPDLGTRTPHEQTFREGTWDLNAQVAVRDGSTGLMDVEPQGLMSIQQGTASSDASRPIMMGVTNAGVSEIPSSSQPVQPTPDLGRPQTEPQRLEVPAGDSSKALESVVRVRSSSALPLDAQMGQKRLEGIRTVLAELETQATIRNTVAELLRAPRPETIRPEPMTGLAGAGGIAAQAVGKQGAATAQSNILDRSVAGVAPDAVDADGDQAYGRTPFGGLDATAASEEIPRTRRPMPNPMAKRSGGEANANATGPAPTAATTSFEAVVGTENSEIATDQEAMVEMFEVDSVTIEADEMPELAVQDLSHLDIDIDDPMGAVRVAMTREAEEVSIRMETPAEVLEEYREMEEEMAETLAAQGLDLSNFSADAQGFGDDADESLPGETARSSNDPEMSQAVGDQELKQSGSVSRLVNRIV